MLSKVNKKLVDKNILLTPKETAVVIRITKQAEKSNKITSRNIDTLADELVNTISTNIKRLNKKKAVEYFSEILDVTDDNTDDTNNEKNIKNYFDTSDDKKLVNYAIKSIFGIQKQTQIQNIFNPSALYERHYVVLDSSNSINYLQNTKKYQWLYANQSNLQQGVANSYLPIKNIVGMRIYPIRLQYYRNFYDYFNQFSLLVEEFAASSYIGHENRRYHFLLSADLNYRVIADDPYQVFFLELTPNRFSKGCYKFNQPIKELSTITLSMGDPFRLIDIPGSKQDCYMVYTNPLTIKFFLYHNITNGDQVLISNFITNNPILDANFIATVNNGTGYTATVVNQLTITIPIDGTVVVSPLTYPGSYLFNRNSKTIFQMEFITIKEDNPTI